MGGVPSPTDNCVVEAVRAAPNRILGTATVNRKEPIPSHLIHKIVSRANLDNPVDLRNVTMYVMFFVSLAFSDLMISISRVRRSNVSLIKTSW